MIDLRAVFALIALRVAVRLNRIRAVWDDPRSALCALPLNADHIQNVDDSIEPVPPEWLAPTVQA